MADKPKRGRPATGRTTPFNLSVRATEAHVKALRELTASTRRSASSEMLLALEAWLTKNRLWPPSPKPPKP